MGAAVSTAQQPLAEVDIKNEIGVLYGEEAQQAFAAAKEDDVFKIARDQIEAVYDEHFTGTVCEIAWRGKGLGDDRCQCGLHGAPATTLDELYAVAEKALLKYGEARNEYAKNTAPATSWLFDVVRGSVMCATEDEIVRLYKALDEDPRVDIVRTKNRFNPPCFNGYRDILMNVAVRVEGAAGEEVLHLCELQIHHAAIKQSEPMHKSHVTYEFFREYFLGNADAVEQRMKMLCALPVDDAENVDDLHAVRVLEKILEIKEREFGPDHREVVFALKHLGGTYGSLGDYAKQRDLLERALAIQERTLAIQEREYGRDHVEVAGTLMGLGNAYGSLGDYAKKRDLLERALAILEREYGSENVVVALALGNLANAHGSLGDYVKQRDVLEHALAILERKFGRDHTTVASTLSDLGDAHGSLGDNAKARELLERALAIQERKRATSSSARSRSTSASLAETT
ncbi:hypothetical protein JL720_4048 [Aureococcus anophagefferens]|nr:hypothetical protein JL720_4048 [Aureococcus anophagefferens]